MRLNEISGGLQKYIAQVRVKTGSSTTTLKTSVEAESVAQARVLLMHLYGQNSVMFVSQTMTEEGAKVLSADEQRVKAMSDQAKRLTQQAKQMKAQNQLKKAQSDLVKAGKV